MPVKMTGAQFKAWMASDWGPDAMWEDEHYTVDGAEVLTEDGDFNVDTIADNAVVVLTSGTIYANQDDLMHSPTFAAVSHAKKWFKAQTTVTLMVDVPRKEADWFARSIGGTGVNGQMAKVTGRIG